MLVLTDTRLQPTARIVYLYLKNVTRTQSDTDTAKALGMYRCTVAKAKADLKRFGYTL